MQQYPLLHMLRCVFSEEELCWQQQLCVDILLRSQASRADWCGVACTLGVALQRLSLPITYTIYFDLLLIGNGHFIHEIC